MTDEFDLLAKRHYGDKPAALQLFKDQKRLDNALDFGVSQNPDVTAKDQVNARRLSIPLDTAANNQAEVDEIARKHILSHKLEKTDFTRRFFSDPQNAAIAHDDADELISVEAAVTAGEKIGKTTQAAGVGVTQATLGISESIWRTPEAAGRVIDGLNKMLGIEAAGKWMAKQGWNPTWDTEGKGTWEWLLGKVTGGTEIADRVNEAQDILQDAYEPFRRMAKKGQQADQAFNQAIEGNFEPLGEVITDPEAWAGFIGQAAPSLYAAYKSGGSIPFIAWLESMEVANNAAEFEQMTGDKVDPVQFIQAAAQVALINSYLEKMGLDKVFGNVGKSTLGSIMRGGLTEAGTEGLQEFNQNLAAIMSFDPSTDPTQGILGAMMGGAGAGGTGGAFSAMGRASGPNSEFIGDLARAQAAEEAQVAMDSMMEAVAATKTRTRDDQVFRKFLFDQLGTENNVYLAPEDAQAFFQSHPEVMEALPEDTRESISEALITNNDVAIPKADYLTYFTDFHAEISDMLRNDIDGMTAREAAQWNETAAEQFDTEAGKILEKMDQDAGMVASADRVAENIQQQIVQTGRMTEDAAKRYGALHRAFAVTVAERTGQTPEQVYERFGLKVQGEPLTEEAFNQTASDLGILTALKLKDGTVVTGKPGDTHAAVDTMLKEMGYTKADVDADGFVDTRAGENKFLNRQEALDIVSKIHHVRDDETTPDDGLMSESRLYQAPLPDAMDQYRSEQEARPITDVIKEPLRNKDGEYRKNAQGDISGAPVGVKTQAQVQAIVTQNIGHMEDKLAAMPGSAEWYEVSGAAIRSVTHGDPAMTERMVRMMAVLSATNQVGGNATGAIKAIYQLSRGEVAAAGRFPNKFALISQHIVDAPDMSYDVPGVDSKVMSFYRNLWDATFLSNKYEDAVTMDMWMARLYGYKTDTFGPAQYRFASMVTRMITDQYNEKHGTSLLPRQIQAALWVYARNRDKYGANVGADISLEDRSAFDTYIKRATQHITFEAVPAVNSGLMPEIHAATPEQKRNYTREAVRLILNENGENELFNRIGVPLYRQSPSEGTFEGVVNPNEIFSIVSDKSDGVVDEGKADLAARVLQYIYTQNAVPWFQLDHTAKGAAQGVAVYHSGQPSVEMEEAFLEFLQTSQQIDADFTRVGNDYFLLNFTNLSNREFKAKVLEAINAYGEAGMPGSELIEEIEGNVKARSNYLAEARKGEEFEYQGLDWSSQEAVGALENEISNSGIPDLLGWARDRREAVARLQADFRDENLSFHQSPRLTEPEIEAEFFKYFEEHFNEAAERYDAIPDSHNGKVFSGDIAKELSPDYMADRTLAAAVHEPSSQFVKDLFAKRIKTEPKPGEERRVILTGGGTGAGKTSGLNQADMVPLVDASHLIYDSNLRSVPSAKAKIGQVLEEDHSAHILYVYREPIDALVNGAIPRAKRMEREFGSGRTVPIKEHVLTHQDSAATMLELAEIYKDNENVHFTVVDNSHGKGGAVVADLEFLAERDYTGVEEKAIRALDQLHDKGEISEAIYQGFKHEAAYTDPTVPQTRPVSGETGQGVREGTEQAQQEEELAQQNRGAISFTADGALISLLENADLSTFLHESGHFFFEMYKELAPESPEIAQDLQVLLDYIGVPDLNIWNEMTLEQRRQGHEQVARAFEAYLFEGQAPSLEIQALFDKLRSWLLDVYKQLRNLNVTLTDDVREVFDRMLATEEQIRARQVANGYAPIFATQEEGAMTAKQWLDYQEQQDRAAGAAQSALERRSLRDMQWLSNARSRRIREMQAAHKAARAEMKKQVTQDLENSPVYQAIVFVTKGELVDVEGNTVKLDEHQLDRDEFKERYPNFNLPRGWTKTGGLPIEDVAHTLGWRSGPEMLDEMLRAAPLKEQIERVTDQRMLEERGELPDMAAMTAAADEAVRSDAHTRFLNTELEHLRKGTGINKVSHQAAKVYAETAIARRKARNIKSYEYARAEARAGRNAMRALQRGDRIEAAEHKRAQVISNHFYRAARNAEKDIERITKYLRKFDRPGTRKNLDRDYLDQIDAIIEKVGLKKISQKEVDRRKSFAEWYDSKVKNNEQVEVPKDYLERLKTHFTEMPYEELSGLRDNVKNIEHLGRLKHKIIVANERADWNETMNAAHDIALKQNPQKHNPEDRAPKNFRFARALFSKFRAHHIKAEFLAEQLDGDRENGLWWNILFRPLADAENTESLMQEELSNALGPILTRDTFKNLDEKILINNKAGYYDKNQVLSMGLNWGNEYNQQALIDGMENQQVTRENIEQVLNENLTAEDWQTIQDIWDLIDSYWPQISELQKKLTGVVPAKVERLPFTTPHGQQMAGGYYPLVFDSELSYKTFTRDQKLSVQELLETNFLRPSTRKGHTIERKNSAGLPVKLDIGVISQHLNNVIHDISYREAILQVDRVIQDGRTADAVERIAGKETYRMLRPWLANAANPHRMLTDPGEMAAKWLRKNTTLVNMGFKLTTAILQPLGYSQSIELLGEKWAMHGLAQFYGNPLKAKALQELVFEKSIMMRNRMKSFDRDINDAIDKIKKEKGKLHEIQQWAFTHIGFMDMAISIPTWKAGYDKALSQGMSEADAIAQADKLVRMSQSAGGAKDLALWQQGSEYKRLLTMFYSYFSSMYNLMRRRRNIMGRGPLTAGKVARASMSFMYLVALPALLSELVVGRGPDEDDDEEWGTWIAKIALTYPLMSVVGVRDVTNAMVMGFGYEITPIAKGVEDMIGAAGAIGNIAMGEGEEADAKKLTMATGYLLGLPSRQLWTIIDNTMAMAEGDDLEPAEMLMVKEQRER